MAQVIVFKPKAELDAAGNLRGFIESCRNELTTFGVNIRFDENVWDVTESLALKGHGNTRQRLVFSTLTSANESEPASMREPFLSFAKAYMLYTHGLRPTKNTGTRITALKSLETALTENGEEPDPTRIDMLIINRAAQIIGERYSETTAYRIGGQLEMLGAFLTENKLTTVPLNWRNHLKRPSDTVRVGKEFDERRQTKMPSEAALESLPKVFRLATEPADVITTSVAAILCAAPDRISEVLLLPENCEVRQRTGKNGNEAYGLRWWPAKGADPMVKWVVTSMVTVVQEAINRIRGATEEARRIAKWYEENPGRIYLTQEFEHLRAKEWLSMGDVTSVFGFGDVSALHEWCKRKALRIEKPSAEILVQFVEVEKAVLAMLPKGFPYLHQEGGLKYSDALLVARRNELGAQRGTYRCMIEPISINQINTGLGSRAKHGFASVFSRLGFAESDGSPIKITTHQFRHYLNTLAQAGGLSQLDIAKWSGRKDIRQNAAYDHVTPDQMLQKIRDAVGDESQMFGPLAELPKKVLIARDEFARLRVPTAHTTDLGFCIHDYTMSPCQLHRDCINCEDLVCVKGDVKKTQRLRQLLGEARDLMERAKQAVSKEYAGSHRWLEHHTVTVDRLTQLCSIMDDPKVPDGAVVQLSPPRANIQLTEKSRARLDAPVGSAPSRSSQKYDIG